MGMTDGGRLPRISGTIHRADGKLVHFQLHADGAHQWGADRPVLGDTVDLMSRLESAAREAGFFDQPDPDEEDECECAESYTARGWHTPGCPADDGERTGYDLDQLRAAAHACVRHDHRLGELDECPLAVILPLDVMPSPDLLALVYAVTGKTEAQRVLRHFLGGVDATGATESAWARVELRRWAICNPHTPIPR